MNSMTEPSPEQVTDFLAQARRSFLAGLQNREPPLEEAAMNQVTTEFTAAIDILAKEHEEPPAPAVDVKTPPPEPKSTEPAPKPAIRQPKHAPAPVLPVKDPKAEDDKADEDNTAPPVTSPTDEQPSQTADAILIEPGKAAHRRPGKDAQIEPGRRLRRSSPGRTVSIFIAVLIAAAVLGLASPLFTIAMDWPATTSIAITGVAIAILVIICTILSPRRFLYAAFAAVIFAAVGLAAHNISQLRQAVEEEGKFLPIIADGTAEIYFFLADLTGIVAADPEEPKMTSTERRAAFMRDVDTWLDQ